MSVDTSNGETGPALNGVSRRGVLRLSARALMSAGLLGGYGFFAWIGSRFMVPTRVGRPHRLFVGGLNEIAVGATVVHETPDGRPVNITRRGNAGNRDDFVALSSTCPHLGCQVHWEESNNRYFCPCHNGTFDSSGKGTGGPPGDAGLSLPRYTLAVEKGLLFILVPAEQLSLGRQARLWSDSATGDAPPRRSGVS
jgi:nitrite reductase/ring-hydroxylating ferredoxin subunit